jgi:hypothetical protein
VIKKQGGYSMIGNWLVDLFRGPNIAPAYGFDPYLNESRYDPHKIWTGLPALDDCLPAGLSPGRHIVIIGAAGSGKSALKDTIVSNLMGKCAFDTEDLGDNPQWIDEGFGRRADLFHAKVDKLISQNLYGVYTMPCNNLDFERSADLVLSLTNTRNEGVRCHLVKSRTGCRATFKIEFYMNRMGEVRASLTEVFQKVG